jgi:ribonuclease Y
LFIVLPVVAGIFFAIGYMLRRTLAEAKIGYAEKQAAQIVDDSRKEATTLKKEAALESKEQLYKAKSQSEKDARERRRELNNLEKRISQKEENLERKVDLIDHKEQDLNKRESKIGNREKSLADLEEEYRQRIADVQKKLETVSGMSSEQARKHLMENVREDARNEAAKFVKQYEEEARVTADKKAKWIIGNAIQRYASDYVAESTVSVVPLPNEEMKGRIIGREGRNIRTLEGATGVDLIIDDTPEAVILSAFDPVRRQVARISLEMLISDGRIHPARIEEVVAKVKKDLDQAIKEAGEAATFDLGVHNVHPEISRLIGRLRYRTSYAQNVLQHSLEVAHFCGMMAAELGLDTKLARRAGLLHDIGKAVDHETEGPHALIGAEMAKRHGEKNDQAADALSAARPGARREVLEAYVKRMEKLEDIATTCKGVHKAYAIQAGREIRIIVQENQVSDSETVYLAKDIARKIEEQLTYPGQIKVTAIREKRAVDYAK